MRRHSFIETRCIVWLACAVALLGTTPMTVAAQASKPAPRLLNGKPDFTGVWDHPRVGDITRNVDGACAAGTRGCKNIGSGELSFTPAGKAEWDKNNKPTTYDYGSHCLPWGFVRSYNTPYPHAYVHHPDRLVILWEQDSRFHMVPTDGRALPADLEPSWMGTSVGRWEGDALVVQAAGFNGRTWLDTAQHPHSDALRLTIRMTRPDHDHMNWDITMEDPKFYTKAIRNVRTFVLMPQGQELYEYSCSENNRCEGGNCVAADIQKTSR